MSFDMKRDGILATLIVLGLALTSAGADEWVVIDDDPWCDGGGMGERYCEIRETTMPAGAGTIRVDAGRNGGIEVDGKDRGDVRVRAKVQVWSRDRDDLQARASRIRLIADGGTIRAEGPDPGRDEGWGVSFHLEVPRASSLDLEAHNGGIEIEDVGGEIRFRTINGGVELENLAGSVRGRTTNGGIEIELEGPAWDGEGLDVETTNGGVELTIPAGYSAELVTGTVNGRIDADFPLPDDGKTKRIRTTLGGGGPTVRVTTTNGGVEIREH